MKLLIENWRQYLDEQYRKGQEKGPQYLFENYPAGVVIFIEWLTYDLKDPIAVYWKENRNKLRDAASRSATHALTPAAYRAVRDKYVKVGKKTWGHINNIKKQFPYDVFPDVEDCQEKLNLLDGLAAAFIEDPKFIGDTSQIQEKLNELKFDPEALTPYERCAIDISNRRKAEKEVEEL
jgi:hypothetical protein